jgi:pyridoxamine 5'-phosphate oxidase
MSLWSTFRAFFTAGKGVFAGLSEESAGSDPLALFHRWFQDAVKSGVYLPESMALGTATPDGRPSVRFVLLKRYDERGFVFFTNYESRKAVELEANPEATLIFHWGILQRQIRLEGRVERISHEESEAYFHTRPRGSQIGAWASEQSRPLASREELEQRERHYEQEFRGREVPLPPFWGGYRLKPRNLEFWQGRANRLHDRIKFFRGVDGQWKRERLYP